MMSLVDIERAAMNRHVRIADRSTMISAMMVDLDSGDLGWSGACLKHWAFDYERAGVTGEDFENGDFSESIPWSRWGEACTVPGDEDYG